MGRRAISDRPATSLPESATGGWIDVSPTEDKVWILGEENLLETINPEKPKTKLATRKIELIAGELERARV